MQHVWRRTTPLTRTVTAVVLVALVATTWPRSDRCPRRMLVTAYCPCTVCCGPKAAGVTASGKRVTANGGKFVAADPRVPFGTMLVIPGYNRGQPVPVYDRGGAIRGNHIDVYFNSHEVARRWGRRWLEVDVAAAAAAGQRPSS